jgi:hypothetical protein
MNVFCCAADGVLLQDRALAAGDTQLAQRCAAPGALQSRSERWEVHTLPVSSQLLEYIPGRDRLLPAPDLAAGLDAYDAGSGEHMLCTLPLPEQALILASPLLLRCFGSGRACCRFEARPKDALLER